MAGISSLGERLVQRAAEGSDAAEGRGHVRRVAEAAVVAAVVFHVAPAGDEPGHAPAHVPLDEAHDPVTELAEPAPDEQRALMRPRVAVPLLGAAPREIDRPGESR